MKNLKHPSNVVVVLFLALGSPFVVYGEKNVEGHSLIQESNRLEMLQGNEENANAKVFTLMNNDLLQENLASTHSADSGVDCQSDMPIRIAALDSQDGPPPCGSDNVCNFSVCSNDPDCPPDMKEPSQSEPYDPPHTGKGSLSVWLSTGPDGFEGGHSCESDSDTCDIKVSWSVQPDKYDKWKICWKGWGDTFTNACNENQKIRKYENNFYVIPNLKEGQHYRLRLEGRKDRNEKWKCLVKARLRNVHLNGTNIRGTVPCFVP